MESLRPQRSLQHIVVSLVRLTFIASVAFFLLNRVYTYSASSTRFQEASQKFDDEPQWTEPLCRNLPGANDTLVVMRTGVTEVEHKLPVHLNTTLSCYPHYLVFSDHEENFRGQHIIDGLQGVNDSWKDNNAEFDLYRRVRSHGRSSLKPNELSNRPGFNRHPSDADKLAMGGWQLDKWKFLSVWDETYRLYPDMKWYVFIEADTYMFWSNMLKYQAALDHTQPYYIGAEIFIDWTSFAHGGAGILMSNAAMKLLVNEYRNHLEDWENFTNRHWAGDIVLGRVLNAAGVTLTPAWPHFHPHMPGNDSYYWADDDRRYWCYPAISYHHVNPQVVSDLWRYEQNLIAAEHEMTLRNQNGRSGKKHKAAAGYGLNTGREAMKRFDVFKTYIHSQMDQETAHWDNNCVDDRGILPSRDACFIRCEDERNCVQWRYDDTTKRCWTRNDPQWGDAAPGTGYYSGWMHERIKVWIDDQIPCGNEGWILE